MPFQIRKGKIQRMLETFFQNLVCYVTSQMEAQTQRGVQQLLFPWPPCCPPCLLLPSRKLRGSCLCSLYQAKLVRAAHLGLFILEGSSELLHFPEGSTHQRSKSFSCLYGATYWHNFSALVC